jgi:hypothetical protein
MPSYSATAQQSRRSIVDTLKRAASQSSKVSYDREAERGLRSRLSSQFHTKRVYLYAWIESIDSLLSVPNNWNSYGAPPPSETAIAATKKVLTSLSGWAIVPENVRASAEGGTAIIFSGIGKNRAIIESLNNGEQYVLLYDIDGRSRTIEWPSGESERAVIEALEDHLRGSPLAS